MLVVFLAIFGCADRDKHPPAENSDQRPLPLGSSSAGDPAKATTEVAVRPRAKTGEQRSTEEILAPVENPEILSQEFEKIWEPWTGDLPGMLQRRYLRALVTTGTYLFYHENGHPKGLVWEQLQDLQKDLNQGRKTSKFVTILPIPVPRDRLIPDLLEGHGDFIATDLSVTPARAAQVEFTIPWRSDVTEIVVTGPGAPDLESLDSLSGRKVAVRLSSSYDEHLQALNEKFREQGLSPVRIHALSEILETDDVLDMLAAGVFQTTIMDDYKIRFWAEAFPAVTPRYDLALDGNNQLAWATRPENPELTSRLNRFLKKHRKGSLLGNILIRKYLTDAPKLARAISREGIQQVQQFQAIFEKYGTQYGYDWLQIAAQAYQESELNPTAQNRSGATGLMQIRPSTARDKNVGIHDISEPQSNVHAGVKYMRFLADRYFNDEKMHPMDQWMFTLAAYNAGPARIQKLRREAHKRGLDQNRWVDNVETVTAHRMGSETVRYVTDIAKYFLGYKLSFERYLALQELRARENSDRVQREP